MNRKKWIAAAAAVIIAGGAYFGLRGSGSDVDYSTKVVKRGDIAVTILSTGTVSPENRLEIKPPVAGRVEDVIAREGQRVKKGQVLAWMSSSERAAMLDAARAQGPDEVKKWEDLYRPTPVLAPIDGTIILRNVEDGQTFTSADAIFVMSDRLTVKAQVDETDISQVKLRQAAKIVLDAYPGQEIPARVDQVAFDAKTVNNVTTYIVDVLPLETPATMRSGMTANVTFQVESKKNVLIVPSDAIRINDAGQTSVLVVDPAGGPPKERAIRVGSNDGKKTEVIDGLSEGETVAVAQLKKKKDKSSRNPLSPFSGGKPKGMGKGR